MNPSSENLVTAEAVKVDPVESARAAGLRYVTDERPGIRRLGSGDGFRYVDPEGNPVTDERTLARIRSLAIPPAYTDVWICPLPHGHLQATGRDARGRKQYRYHPRWRATRDETKFTRMLAFADALPALRRRVERDLRRRTLSREKVLAVVVRLLEATAIRVGNEAYAKANRSFGLTTMRDRHVDIHGATVDFHFRGKSGQSHEITLTDRRLARLVRQLRDLPGQSLFQYLDDDGVRQTVDSGDVNAYLFEVTGQPFTAKDFRTWIGSVVACQALGACERAESEREVKGQVATVLSLVADQLGNTVSVCRKYYVHPLLVESFLDGSFPRPRAGRGSRGLRPEERELVTFLRKR